MNNKYVLPNTTMTEAMKQIPRDKWQKFCGELYEYMTHHADACEGMKMLADAGLIKFEEPTTFTWVDDDKGEVTITVRDAETGDEGSVVLGGNNDHQ